MSELVQVVDDGGKPLFLIEAEGMPPGGFRSAAPGQALAGLNGAGRAVAAVCSDMVSEIQSGLARFGPTTIELHLGVKISAEGGLPIITKAGAEATIDVKVVWDRPSFEKTL